MPSRHRSSDEPMPYGPPPQGQGDPNAPAAPGPVAPPPPGPPPPPPPDAPPPVAPWAPPPGAYAAVPASVSGLQYGRTLDRAMAYWLDGLLIGIPSIIVVFLATAAGAIAGVQWLDRVAVVLSVVVVGTNLLYFVAFWTGDRQATPGMRLMKLRIGEAENGSVLTVQQGLVRWLAIGGVFQLVQLVPGLTALGATLGLLWVLVLLATTAMSPTKQGLHDRIAGTALVQPLSAQTPAVTCLVIAIALVALSTVAIVGLALLGSQVSSVLSSVGGSI